MTCNIKSKLLHVAAGFAVATLLALAQESFPLVLAGVWVGFMVGMLVGLLSFRGNEDA